MAIPFICLLIVRFLLAASTPMLAACAKSGELEEVGADPFFARGLQHFLAGNHPIAIAAFQKALEQGGEGREAYRYLAESIRRFPDQQTFAAMMGEAGLAQIKVRNLSGGIAALHSAWRI